MSKSHSLPLKTLHPTDPNESGSAQDADRPPSDTQNVDIEDLQRGLDSMQRWLEVKKAELRDLLKN